jgi:hypothetical protein
VALGLDVRPKEIVIGDADALEGLDQQAIMSDTTSLSYPSASP